MLPYLSTCKCFLCKWQRERPKNLEDRRWFRKARRKHKKKYGEALSRDFFQYYHKPQYYAALRDELMRIAWHPNRWWDWCMPEDKKQEISGGLWS